MRKLQNTLPLDYSLCTMEVTVYHREGLTRRLLQGVHYEFTDSWDVQQGMASHSRQFLLVIPGADAIGVGDKVVLGHGPEVIAWEDLNTAQIPTLGVVQSVKPRYFRGKPCHVEARGG